MSAGDSHTIRQRDTHCRIVWLSPCRKSPKYTQNITIFNTYLTTSPILCGTIKPSRHYWQLNPSCIVPAGTSLAGGTTPHHSLADSACTSLSCTNTANRSPLIWSVAGFPTGTRLFPLFADTASMYDSVRVGTVIVICLSEVSMCPLRHHNKES